jgi:hypothetical protein
MWIAAAGLAASVIVHVSSLLGLPQPFGHAAWALHVGIFVVWIPAVIVAQKLSKGAKQADFWKAVLRGCPPWMRRLLYGLVAYTFINFFVGIALGPDTEAENFRIFSGHWMFFYFAGMAMLYSADRLGSLAPRTCPQGHEVSPFAKFCEECGSQLPPLPIA